jgi:trk system potassium uptake protein
VLGFFFIYVTVWVATTLILTAVGLDLVSSAAAAAATLNVVGVGMGKVGALENFGAVPEAGRAVLTFVMLVGRLEVFTVLVLLTPAFWRRQWV